MACILPDLLMNDTETSLSELSTIAPLLLHSLIPIFHFSHVSCVSDVILEEFGIKFIPFNQIGLSLAHGLRKWKFGARMGKASDKMEAKIVNQAEGWRARGK